MEVLPLSGHIAKGDLSRVKLWVLRDPKAVNRMVGVVNKDGVEVLVLPLHVASTFGQLEIATYLLDRGANINQGMEPGGMTPLHYACGEGHVKVVDLLLERGADPSIATPMGYTPLMVASFVRRVDCVRSLLGHDAAKTTINAQSVEGATALHRACLQKNEDVARLLVGAGADLTVVDKAGFTPMSAAKAVGSKGIVGLLQVSGK